MARSAILRHSVRLYGTTEPESIGHAVSSGDIRMPNLVVVDLANRVPVGAHGAVGQGVMGRRIDAHTAIRDGKLEQNHPVAVIFMKPEMIAYD